MSTRALTLALLLALPLAARAQPSSAAARDIDAALRTARAESVCGAEAGLAERARSLQARFGDRSTTAYAEATAARLRTCVADLESARTRALLAGGSPPSTSPRPAVELGAVQLVAGEGALDAAMLQRLAATRTRAAASCAGPSVLDLPRDVRGDVVLSLTLGTAGEVTSASATSNTTGHDALAGCALEALHRVRVSPAPDRPVTFTVELRYVGWR